MFSGNRVRLTDVTQETESRAGSSDRESAVVVESPVDVIMVDKARR